MSQVFPFPTEQQQPIHQTNSKTYTLSLHPYVYLLSLHQGEGEERGGKRRNLSKAWEKYWIIKDSIYYYTFNFQWGTSLERSKIKSLLPVLPIHKSHSLRRTLEAYLLLWKTCLLDKTLGEHIWRTTQQGESKLSPYCQKAPTMSF